MTGGNRRRQPVWLAGGSIAGLLLGFLAGSAIHRAGGWAAVVGVFDVFGTIWGNALRMVVMPLVVAQLMYTVIAPRGSGSVGRIGAITVVTFLGMLLLGGFATVAAMPIVLAQLQLTPEALAAFRSAVIEAPGPAAASAGLGDWLIGLLPSNPLRAVLDNNLVGVMLFALAFAAAVARMPVERRTMVGDLSRAVADAMMTIVRWVMWFMPITVFGMALSTAARGGLGTLEVVIVFVLLVCGVMLAWTFIFYPLAAVLGGIPLAGFARAVLPVQLVGLSTRSSIASLPALMDGAEHRLGLRADVTSLVMPLAVSAFKVSYPISSPVQFMFVAYVYGIPLAPTTLIAYVLGILLLSLASVGIPNGGAMMRAAPFYIAAGVPIEGYLLTEAVETIPDIFKTLVNVTGDMTAAAIVNRFTNATDPARTPTLLRAEELTDGGL